MACLQVSSVLLDCTMWPSYLFSTSSCFSRFLQFMFLQGPGFSESRFFRVQVFQGPGFLGSGSRVWFQVLEVAFFYFPIKKILFGQTLKLYLYHNFIVCHDEIKVIILSNCVNLLIFLNMQHYVKSRFLIRHQTFQNLVQYYKRILVLCKIAWLMLIQNRRKFEINSC